MAYPLLLAILVGLLEAASFSVLVPLSDGVAAGSFRNLGESDWFGWMVRLIPQTLLHSPSGDAYAVLGLIAFLVASRFAKLGVEYARVHFLYRRNHRYIRIVRDETFGRVLVFGRQYFDRNALGHIDSELGWSHSAVTVLAAVEDLFLYSIRLAMKGVLVFLISPVLFGAFMVSLVVLQLLLRRLSAAAGGLAAEAAAVHKRVRREVLDLLGTIPLVKAYTQERSARQHHHDILKESEEIEVRRGRLHHLSYPLEEGIVLIGALLAEALILSYDTGSVAGHLARFCAFFLVAQQCLPDVRALSMARVSIAEQLPLLETVANLFEDEGKFIVPAGTRRWTGLRHAIEIRDLRFQYQSGTAVLRGIDAVFPAGRLTAVVGQSGAGKTSLIDLIARQYDCPPGTIRVDGVDIREFDPEEFGRRISVVSQDVWLLNRSLRGNLVFGLDASVSDDQILDILDEVGLRAFFEEQTAGLDTEIGDRGVRLSGGQRQRLALARTLLREPEIIILDEATSALDSVMERKVLDAFQRRLAGRTMIVIAHRLSTVRHADNILVMHDGRIAESGTWDELIARGRLFAELHEAQSGKDANPMMAERV